MIYFNNLSFEILYHMEAHCCQFKKDMLYIVRVRDSISYVDLEHYLIRRLGTLSHT